jgi:hypothetical protein
MAFWSSCYSSVHAQRDGRYCCGTPFLHTRGVAGLIPRNGALLEKLAVPQLVKKLLEFVATGRFITAFTRTRLLSLQSPRCQRKIASPRHCKQLCNVPSSSSNPGPGRQPLVSCPWMFIQYIRCYPPYLAQPENAPSHSDGGPMCHGHWRSDSKILNYNGDCTYVDSPFLLRAVVWSYSWHLLYVAARFRNYWTDFNKIRCSNLQQ